MPSLIGNKPNQVPSNGDLGTLAFQDSNAVNLTGGTAVIDNLTADAINLKVDTDISNIAPSLNLDFANSKTLDPRITYTRASTATYYDGVTTAKAEENLISYSQEFDNAYWIKDNATVTANSTASPDGTTTAETITDNATSSNHSLRNPVIAVGSLVAASTQVVGSVYLKAGTNNFAFFSFADSSTGRYAALVVDLSSGTITQTAALVSTINSTSIVDAGNGWYRVILNATAGSTGFNRIQIGLAPASTGNTFSIGTISYVGTGKTIFAWGAQAEIRSAVSSYTPTTTQAITNYIPALQTAASGVARFDHNPTTGESLGLLIEEQRTNLVTYSEQFDNAAWTNTNLTPATNTIVAPDGTLTGDKLIDNTTNSTHFSARSLSVTNATAYTFSVYAKAGEKKSIRLNIVGATNATAWYNLDTGLLGTVAAGVTASMASVGNGWYRCLYTRTVDSTTATTQIHLGNPAESVTFAGNGFDGIYIWGAQLEAGAFATSYIPTVASQVTRSADAASMTGTNFSSWFNNQEGSIYQDFTAIGINSIDRFSLLLSDTGAITTNSLSIRNFAGTQVFAVYSSSTLQAAIVTSAVIANTANKISCGYATNDFAASKNGSSVVVDTLGLTPLNLSQLSFPSSGCNTIKKIQYFPKRLTNAELVEMTA